MKLKRSQYRCIFSIQFSILVQLFERYNHEIRLCGGAVRDILLGQKPTDLDFATTATPDEMLKMFGKENYRIINKGGIKHGTVTPLIRGMIFEITTLRIDVRTDGRHADVEFTKDWKLDAQRRDFTVNSMFLGMDGTLYDYFNGYDDLNNQLLRFVGDPQERIKEDYLRILRYFRFYERIVNSSSNHDENILKAIKENGSGLNQVSGQRIWPELRKILKGNYGPVIFKTILSLELGPYIGFPYKPNIKELDRLVKETKGFELEVVTLISALLNDSQDVTNIANRLKFSATEKNLATFLIQERGKNMTPKAILNYKVEVILHPNRQEKMKNNILQLLIYKNERKIVEEFKKWEPKRFPITGEVIKTYGVEKGKPIGLIVRRLVEYWAIKHFTGSRKELLVMLPKIIKDLKKNNLL